MSARIGLGMAAFPFASARAFREWVELCEESDIDSIWQSDRLISPQPQLEAMSTMAALAGATDRLKFGMSVVVLPLRDPLVLAMQCATIDFLSDGRLLPAFGVGPEVAPEWVATGRAPRGRGPKSDEMLEIVTRLWRGETVSFEGEHYRYKDASIAPLPAQQPLPLWIGGSSPAAVRRIARFGNGWLGGLQSPAQVAPVVESIRRVSREAGRPVPEDHYGASFPFRFGGWDDPVVERAAGAMTRRPGGPDRADPRDYFAVGDASAIVERIDEYAAAGVSKFVMRPIAENDGELMAQTRMLAETVLPVVHGQ